MIGQSVDDLLDRERVFAVTWMILCDVNFVAREKSLSMIQKFPV